MHLPNFNFHQPTSIHDAIALLGNNSNSAAMAGGTDLLVEMKKGLRNHNEVVSLAKINEMKLIFEDEVNLYIGACATHSEIIVSPLVNKNLAVLAEAAAEIGSEQVRNTGTIGGNLCTAASCCDSAPVLLAMNASLEIANMEGARTLPLCEFFTFNKKTILEKGDLVTRVIIPKSAPGTGAAYVKFGLRESGCISVVSVAARLRIVAGTCVDACIVIGAVAPTPKISSQATELLKGKKISEFSENSILFEEAGDAAVRDSIPIDDIRGGAQFRRDVLKVVTRRAILKALEALSPPSL